jgi:hypothetical protein
MGLTFGGIEQEQLERLEAWLGPLRERDWLVQNRRRTQRVVMRVPVRISGQNSAGSQFQEETHTLAVNANGALVVLSRQEIVEGARWAALFCMRLYRARWHWYSFTWSTVSDRRHFLHGRRSIMQNVQQILQSDPLVKLIQRENFVGWIYSIDYPPTMLS